MFSTRLDVLLALSFWLLPFDFDDFKPWINDEVEGLLNYYFSLRFRVAKVIFNFLDNISDLGAIHR